MLWNNPDKRIKKDTLYLEIEKLKGSFCDEILLFAQRQDSLEAAKIIREYKELLSKHLVSVKNDFADLELLSQEILDKNIDEIQKVFTFNNREVFLHCLRETYYLIYFIGFDLLYQMYKYGLITLHRKEKYIEILFVEIIFYQDKIDPSIDSLQHIRASLATMDNATSVAELEAVHDRAEQELLRVFRVRDKHVLFDIKSGEFEKFYGTSPISLLQEKRHIYSRNKAKLDLMQKGIINFGQEHIELIIVEQKIKDLYQNQDEHVEFIGQEQYNKMLNRLLSTKESLLNKMSINEGDLAIILS